MEGGGAGQILVIRIGAIVEEQAGNRNVAVLRGDGKRRIAVLVGQIGRAAVLEQRFDLAQLGPPYFAVQLLELQIVRLKEH